MAGLLETVIRWQDLKISLITRTASKTWYTQ